MSVKEAFVAAFLEALPEGFATEKNRTNRIFAEAIGAALDKVPLEIHHHYHLMPNHVMHQVGDAVSIEPQAAPQFTGPVFIPNIVFPNTDG
jgi:hypothetical protein